MTIQFAFLNLVGLMSSNTPSSNPPNDRAHLIGIALMVSAMLIIPFLDAIAKDLSTRYSVTQITWARYFFHFALLLPIVLLKFGPRALLPKSPGLQLVRSTFLMCATFFYFSAISLIPLADALALVFISPFVVTVLSALILKEAVGPRRWGAVIVGLLGALVIVRPGFVDGNLGTLFAMGAAITYACYLISTRKLAHTAPPMVTLTFSALVGAVVFSALVPTVWIPPTGTDFFWMILLGVVAALGHYLIIKAFDYAEASLLAPYGYTEIIMTCLLGYLVFGDLPDGFTWLGMGIIVASGIYISVRERRVHN